MENVNFLLVSVIFVIATNRVSSLFEDTLLPQMAVTSLANQEDFYVRIKQETQFKGAAPSILRLLPVGNFGGVYNYDGEDKSQICARILNSPFFEVDTNSDAANATFVEKEYFANWPLTSETEMNTYWRREVLVGESKSEERVFRCVVRVFLEPEFYSYEEYFISPVYQWSTENLVVDGRFLFIKNNHDDELLVHAVAEEPAVVDDNVIERTHSAYYEARSGRSFAATLYNTITTKIFGKSDEPTNHVRGLDASSNSVCSISVLDKIRLCSIALNASEFAGKVKFPSSADYVEAECSKKVVSARLKSYKQHFYSFTRDIDMTYEEWMVGCKLIPTAGETEPSTYYISRGLDEYTAIVFTPSTTKNDTWSPHAGLNGVRLIFGSGVIKPISVIEDQG